MADALMQAVPASSIVAHCAGLDLGFSVEDKRSLFVIPMDYDDYPETEAICMTGHTQLKWIAQLAHSIQVQVEQGRERDGMWHHDRPVGYQEVSWHNHVISHAYQSISCDIMSETNMCGHTSQVRAAH